jgi:hypothetical protein
MSKPNPNAPREYFLMDPDLRSIGRTQVPRGDTKVTVTPAEAEFYLTSGGLSETDPKAKAKEDKAAARKAQD